MVYPTLLPLMRTPRLPVVDWTDAPRRFKWTRPFRRKTKPDFCACAITFQLASNKTDLEEGVYEDTRKEIFLFVETIRNNGWFMATPVTQNLWREICISWRTTKKIKEMYFYGELSTGKWGCSGLKHPKKELHMGEKKYTVSGKSYVNTMKLYTVHPVLIGRFHPFCTPRKPLKWVEV